MTADHGILTLHEASVVRAGRTVLRNVSLSVGAGEVLVVIGANGAGKSSLLEAVVGALPLASGAVSVHGQPLVRLADFARSMSFVAAEAEPPFESRVNTLIEDACERGRPPAALRDDLLRRLDLERLRAVPIGALSRGERRRVLLFCALVLARTFLVLDEPTGVFDPAQLIEIVKVFREHAQRGHGLLLSVHQMSDAEALADQILILHEGQVLACGPLAALRTRARVGAEVPLQAVFLSLLREARGDQVHDARS
jgi:ABC-type multidrug transport system ATPase subunit